MGKHSGSPGLRVVDYDIHSAKLYVNSFVFCIGGSYFSGAFIMVDIS